MIYGRGTYRRERAPSQVLFSSCKCRWAERPAGAVEREGIGPNGIRSFRNAAGKGEAGDSCRWRETLCHENSKDAESVFRNVALVWSYFCVETFSNSIVELMGE